MEAAGEAGVLDLDAAIHHDGQPGLVGHVSGLLVAEPELCPERLGPDGDGVGCYSWELIAAPEDVDQVR